MGVILRDNALLFPLIFYFYFLFWTLMLFDGPLIFSSFFFFSFDFLLSTLDSIRDTKQPIGQSGVSIAFVL